MSWGYYYAPRMTAAQRREKARQAARKLAAKGRKLSPVTIDGTAIAKTFWGKAWCQNLESYSDYANRLPRGRTYVRSGSVIDLQIGPGDVQALVQGTNLYEVSIAIMPLPAARWKAFKKSAAGKVTNMLDLLQGQLPKGMLSDITQKGTGLFPAPAQIKFSCSCPDWAGMCKHVAAALYGVGARLDAQPELFFTLRGVAAEELISAASAQVAAEAGGGKRQNKALAGADLSELFGVDIDTGAESNPANRRTPGPKRKTTPGQRAKPPQTRAKPPARPPAAKKRHGRKP